MFTPSHIQYLLTCLCPQFPIFEVVSRMDISMPLPQRERAPAHFRTLRVHFWKPPSRDTSRKRGPRTFRALPAHFPRTFRRHLPRALSVRAARARPAHFPHTFRRHLPKTTTGTGRLITTAPLRSIFDCQLGQISQRPTLPLFSGEH